MPEYFTIEEKLQRLIYEKYGLDDLTDEFYLPLYNSKHTEDGFWDRVEVLEEFYDQTREFVAYIRNKVKILLKPKLA